MQSFITGQLLIEVDFHPGTPVSLKGLDKDYIEIPTLPSTGEKLSQALAKLDLDGLKKNLESTLAGVDRLINNPDLTAGIKALKETLQDASKLVKGVERQVDPLADDLKKTVKDIGKLARNADAQVAGVTAGLDKTMSAARGVLSEDSPLMAELQNALKELAATGRSFRQLADFLEQHPETVIRGKKSPGGK
jgi:paraquat-inducible protein B